jgi:hypothetical protein
MLNSQIAPEETKQEWLIKSVYTNKDMSCVMKIVAKASELYVILGAAMSRAPSNFIPYMYCCNLMKIKCVFK